MASNIFFSITLLLAPAISSAFTLCDKDQDVYFSCKGKNNKFISVCGLAELQYRYGTKSRLELIFPANKSEAMRENAVIIGSTQNYNPETVDIHFNTGKYRYTVYSAATKDGDTSEYQASYSGVKVEKVHKSEYWNETFITNIQCITTDTNFVKMWGWRKK